VFRPLLIKNSLICFLVENKIHIKTILAHWNNLLSSKPKLKNKILNDTFYIFFDLTFISTKQKKIIEQNLKFEWVKSSAHSFYRNLPEDQKIVLDNLVDNFEFLITNNDFDFNPAYLKLRNYCLQLIYENLYQL